MPNGDDDRADSGPEGPPAGNLSASPTDRRYVVPGVRVDKSTRTLLWDIPDGPPVRYPEFARVLEGHRKILIVTHNNPDPDAMASAIGFYTILTRKFGLEVRVGHGGTIGRSENKAMVRDLDLPVFAVNLLDISNYDGVILVDTQFETGYHCVPPEVIPLAVFDHHPPVSNDPKGTFVEIQTEVGSTSAIATQYLLASGVDIDTKVATALMYGIRTDTLNFFRHANEWDVSAHQALFPRVDHSRLANIESPPLPRGYFKELYRALERAMIHGRVVLTDLGAVKNPDMIPLVSDMLLRYENATWAITLGLVEKEMRLSVRTSEPDGDAGTFIRKVIQKQGVGGGHGEMAAAQISLTAQHEEVQYDIVAAELIGRILKILGLPEAGKPLARQRPPSKPAYPIKKSPPTTSGPLL